MDLYSLECPKKCKTISVKKLVKPWITDNIRRMANYKHHLFKLHPIQSQVFEGTPEMHVSGVEVVSTDHREYNRCCKYSIL